MTEMTRKLVFVGVGVALSVSQTSSVTRATETSDWKAVAVEDSLWRFFRVEQYHEGIEEILIRSADGIPTVARIGAYKARIVGRFKFTWLLAKGPYRPRGAVLVTVDVVTRDESWFRVVIWASDYSGTTETRMSGYLQTPRMASYAYQMRCGELVLVEQDEVGGLCRIGAGPPSGEFSGKLMKCEWNKQGISVEGRVFSDEEFVGHVVDRIAKDAGEEKWEIRIYGDAGRNRAEFERCIAIERSFAEHQRCILTFTSVIPITEPKIEKPVRKGALAAVEDETEDRDK